MEKLKESNQKAIDAFSLSLSRLYTGRPTPRLLSGIKVQYYNEMVSLDSVATVLVKNASALHVIPWDTSILKDIKRAIHFADLGLTPESDAEKVIVRLPKKTIEAQDKIFDLMEKKAEQARVSIRLNRKKMRKGLDKDEKAELDKAIQTETNNSIKAINKLLKEKTGR